MQSNAEEIMELHWLFDMLNHIDLGLVVVNKQYQVTLWNSFMENHSGKSSSTAKGKSLFELFPDVDEEWLKRKLDNVFNLRTSVFISWEQSPYLFPFKSYRPITGLAEHMYQNITLRPLANADGSLEHVCIAVYDVTDVASNKAALSSANHKLEQLSRMDPLTDLNNRNGLDKALELTFRSFLKKGTGPHSLVMVDLDHFKQVNDTHGHIVGDQVLKEIAQEMLSSTRRGDFVARYGGEEFFILLPNTDRDGAVLFSEKLREKIASMVIKSKEADIQVTVSLGVAELNEKDKTVLDWLSRADKALYKAKQSGRNQTAF